MGKFFRSAGIIILCIVSATLVLLFSWLPKGGVYPWVVHRLWGPGLLWLAGGRLSVKGLENLPRNPSRAIYISNHQSHFDIPAITTAVPVPFYFIAKKELKHIPIFGWGMWSIGMVFVDRDNREKAKKSMLKAARSIEKGKAVLTFPEGTRSKSGELQRFKKGAFHIAKSGRMDIIPLSVQGTREILPSGGKFTPGQDILVKVGNPIPAEKIETLNLLELVSYCEEKIAELLES